MTGPKHTRHPRDLADLTDIVHELTSPREHRQSYRAGWRNTNRTGPVIRDHITHQPSLLDQLRAAVSDRSGVSLGTNAGKMTYTVLPRFSADAFDRLQAIRTGVTDWATALGIGSEATRRADHLTHLLDQLKRIIATSGAATYAGSAALDVLYGTATYIRTSIDVDLRHLTHHAGTLTTLTLDELVTDADRWRTWCRIMTGWETPAFRPHIPCPHCQAIAGERAGLRIRIDSATGTGGIIDNAGIRAAVCLSCNRTWDADTVGLLAEQLRQAGQLLDGPT